MPRLVTIGDSLTQGFQHAAIRRSQWSYPAMVGRVLGAPFESADFTGNGHGGPLVDLELVARMFAAVGKRLSLLDAPAVAAGLGKLHSFMSELEDYWERDEGAEPSGEVSMHHNLAVWGFEILDALTLSDGVCARNTPKPNDDVIAQIPEMGMYRTARRVLNPRQEYELAELTQLELAQRMSTEYPIDDLIFALGANNALATCLYLKLIWSQSADLRKLAHQRRVTIWEPDHFIRIYDRAVAQLEKVRATRVYLATIPHVTIAPVTRGVTPKWMERGIPEVASVHGSKRLYYEYYTRFWYWDTTFDKDSHDERITREDAWAIDNAIDEYNAHIREVARARGWGVIDFCEKLDQLAFRSTKGKPTYELPSGLVGALKKNPATKFRVRDDGVLLDSRFMRLPKTPISEKAPFADWQRGYCGGLFGLDGVHPTTVGYGIMAHETLAEMARLGAPGANPEALPWRDIVTADTLLTNPPELLASLEETLTFFFKALGLSRLIEKVSGTGSQP